MCWNTSGNTSIYWDGGNKVEEVSQDDQNYSSDTDSTNNDCVQCNLIGNWAERPKADNFDEDDADDCLSDDGLPWIDTSSTSEQT